MPLNRVNLFQSCNCTVSLFSLFKDGSFFEEDFKLLQPVKRKRQLIINIPFLNFIRFHPSYFNLYPLCIISILLTYSTGQAHVVLRASSITSVKNSEIPKVNDLMFKLFIIR